METNHHTTGEGLHLVLPRVLLVDSEPELTAGLAIGLRREGWELHRAHSVEDALERAESTAYDVVVCDEGLADLLEELRQRRPECARVLLISQSAIESSVEAVNASRIYRFIFKPCSASEVALTIHHALAQRDQERRIRSWCEERSQDRLALVADYERAVDSLWMGFQPVITAAGRVFGYEALVRTDEPSIRTPQRLFGAARELGRFLDLGMLIRRSIAERIPEAPEHASFLVNVHPDDFADASLFDPEAPLSAHASRIVLEIGQRSAMLGDEIRPEIDRLRELGFGIAIDDLGAGYSGLTNFAALGPDLVKLDMELVRDIDRMPTQHALASTVVSLCSDLGIETVAEGIETEEEWNAVLDLGCDHLQGFLFAEATRDFARRLTWRPEAA